ncbi:MAG TPA: c-type cytochrome biogenesis protein CcsB [Mycobacteriales bacterium]|nr:c-type cytochrome biogenesis protein CcsB [Mycobacteriales bacterium]
MTADPDLAAASDWLLFGAVLCYVVAMLGYAAELAFGRRAPDGPAPIAGGSTDTLPAEWVSERAARRVARHGGERGWPTAVGKAAVAVTVLGWLLHNGSLVTRGLAVERVPWGNMYEFSSAVCLAAVTAYLYLLTRQPVRYLGAFVMLPVVVYLGIAGTVLYAPAAPLVPALNSYWIKIHVVAAMTSSGIFMLGFAVTLLYLARESWERRHPEVPEVGAGAASRVRFPAASTLDTVAFRVNAFAFPIWTFAVIAGAVWAEAAWGRYWGWDPKETWSFITWVVYAGYLHARATAGWRGRRAALIGVAGFTALMICYYAVNLWISGLHSYAGV